MMAMTGHWKWISLMCLALIAAGGCSSKLATGYEPRKLGDSESQRRTYYAAPYSPDSHATSYGGQ
jgi:hypothetical protein